MTALTVTTKRLATHLRTAGPADGEPVIFLLKGPSMFSGYLAMACCSSQASPPRFALSGVTYLCNRERAAESPMVASRG